MKCCDKWNENSRKVFDQNEMNFCPFCGKEHKKIPEVVEVSVFTHSSKESMITTGEKIGLAGEALNSFSYGLCEVEFFLRVNTVTGFYEILQVKET